jgi:transposase
VTETEPQIVRELRRENIQLRQEKSQLRQESIQLRQQAHYYKSQHERGLAREGKFKAQIQALKAKLAEVLKRLFARKAEGKSKSESTKGKPQSTRSRGQQPGAPGHGRKCRCKLPVNEVVIEGSPEEKRCEQCGLPREEAGTEEGYEEIEWEVRLVRKRIRRRRYKRTCRCPGTPIWTVAAAPPRLIPKGLLSTGTIVEMLRLKFKFHMPVHRILGMARSHGLELSAGTVCGIWQRLPPLLEPLYLAIVEYARRSGQFLMDETRWERFELIEGKKSTRCWLWVVATPVCRVYLLRSTRGSSVPKDFFGWDEEEETCQWTGYLMVDRYSSYKFLVTALFLAFCWTHVRRDFVMARAGADAAGLLWADEWIDRIGQLYGLNKARIELARDREKPALPAPFVRLDVARMKTPEYAQAQQALQDSLDTMAQEREAQLVPVSLCPRRRKILESLRAHWTGLTLFLKHPEIPMDNNGAERVARPAAVGRKNYYGSGSVWSGELMAMVMTLFQTLPLYGIDERLYLIGYLEACARNQSRPPKDLTPWLPWNFKATVSGATCQARAP